MKRWWHRTLSYLIALIGLGAAGTALGQPIVPQDERDIARQLVAHDHGLTYAIDQGWLSFQSPIEYADPETGDSVLTSTRLELGDVTFSTQFAYMDSARVAVWFRIDGSGINAVRSPDFELLDESGLPWYVLRAQQLRRFGRSIYGYVDFSFMRDQVDTAQIGTVDLPYPRTGDPAVTEPLQFRVQPDPSVDEIYTLDVTVTERPASVALVGTEPAWFEDRIQNVELLSGGNRLEVDVWTERTMMAPTLSRANVCVGWDHDAVLYPIGYIENIGYAQPFNLYEDLPLMETPVMEVEERTARCMVIEASVPANYRNNFALIVVTGWTDNAGLRYGETSRITLEIGFV